MFRFIAPELSDAEQILSWRRKPRVADMMLTDISADLEKQRAWMIDCMDRTEYTHWLICRGEQKIGLLSLDAIDWSGGETSWGYYIGEENYLGIGGLIPPFLYNFVFFELDFSRIISRVVVGNDDVLDLHEFHGYRKCRIMPDVAERNGRSVSLHELVLSRSDWEQKTRFHRFRADFPLPTHFQALAG